MKKALLVLTIVLSTIVITVAQSTKNIVLKPTDSQIRYLGRMTDGNEGEKKMFWSGSSVKLNFKGTALSAWLQDESGNNYYNVIIDGDSLLLLRPGKEKSLYTLAENLPAGKHTVELFRRTEWDRGYTAFYGFELPAGSKVLAKDKPTKLKIEFYGNSITAGYAVDDAEPNDRPDSTFTNFYHSYAYVTAKSLNADYQATCKSGIGILISWFPTIMPQIYDRVNPYDSLSKWDFKKFQADVVVLNLFQNDSWLIHKPERPEFQTFLGGKEPTKDEIIAAYKSFVAKLRAKYPKAKIVCMLGNMDITREGSPWPGYVKEAVSQMADKSIYTFFEPAKSTGGHPRADEQALMAKHLTEFISGLK